MTEQQSSYRQIIKATSLFGGVQVFNILISIIRSKVIAVLLGPAGMGIMGLLTSTTGLLTSITNFGLGTSAVKNIAEAHASNNQIQIAKTTTIFKRLVWITGLFGLMLTLVLSPWLSQLTFGNEEYTFAFAWLSVTLLFQQLSSGQLVILQGTRQLKSLAKANVLGSALGLIVTLPLYYFYRIDGIVTGIIGSSIVTMLLSWYFSSKIRNERVTVNWEETISQGRDMLRMGFLISLSGLMTVTVSYLVRVYISHAGGVEQVGLYNAGFAIINTYVGLIFSAMATDYYPRLSAVSTDNAKCRTTINQQAEIAILILAPILIVFLVFINWVIVLLYSKQFLAVSGMIYWAVLGMFFKAATWAIGFILLAKGKSKIFFISELISNSYMLVFNVLGYHLMGLTGLGVSFLISYLFALIQIFFIARIKFEFHFESQFQKLFVLQFFLALLVFLTITYFEKPTSYFIGIVLITASSWISIKELNKRIGLVNLFQSKIKNR